MQPTQPLFLVTGKSAGHIIPCITLAQQHPDARTIFFSTNTPLDRQLLAHNPAINRHIPLKFGSWGHTRWWQIPLVIVYGASAFVRALYYAWHYRPQKVISTGGAVSIPVCVAAFLMRIPIELFELNRKPGSAITFLAPIATSISYCFKGTASYFAPHKSHYAPYPVRFASTDSSKPRSELLQQYNFKPDATTILILGGSQGSVSLNKAVGAWLTANSTLPVQVIHQTGAQDTTNWKEVYARHNIPAVVVAYTDDVQDFYAVANVVICRSGAGTLFETLFYTKRCITVPLELANNTHQKDNADALAAEYPNLISVVRQHDLINNPAILSPLIFG